MNKESVMFTKMATEYFDGVAHHRITIAVLWGCLRKGASPHRLRNAIRLPRKDN